MSDCYFKVRPVELADSPEILAAVDWWYHKLAVQPHHDAGDADIELAANWAAITAQPATNNQRAVFRESLIVMVAVDCARSWQPNEPNWGSATRCIGTDYGPGPRLAAALAAAGITKGSLLLPIKTTMWINPGTVTVAEGYGGGKEQVVWIAKASPLTDCSNHRIDRPVAKQEKRNVKRTTTRC